MNLRSLTLAALALATLSPIALAQQDGAPPTPPTPPPPTQAPAEDALAQGRALREKLKERDAALDGTTSFGIYLNGQKNVGSVKIDVAASDKGAYATKSTMKIKIGPNSVEQLEEITLATDMGATAYTLEKTELQGEEKKSDKVSATLAEGKWAVKRVVDGGAEESATVEADRSYRGLVSALLLVRKLDLAKAASYELQGVSWGRTEPKPSVSKVVITVASDKAKIKHRGQEVEVQRVRVQREGEDEAVFLMAEGRVLQVLHEGAPFSLIVGTPEEAGQDIAGTGATGQPAADPQGAMRVYLDVLCGRMPAAELDVVVDWVAVVENLRANHPELANMEPEMVAEAIKGQLGAAPVVSAEIADALFGQVEVDAQAETATLKLPMDPRPFELKKSDKGWRFTKFPE